MRKLLVLACLAGIVLTGCSDGSADHRIAETTGPGSVYYVATLRSAPERTLDAGSMRMMFEFSFAVGAVTQEMTGSAEFRFAEDQHDTQAHMRFEYPSFGQGAPGGSVEMIIDRGPVIYLSADLFGEVLPIDTQWIRMDPSSYGDGWPGMDAMTGGQTDPSSSLSFLLGAVDVENVGPETIDGTPTTHYLATVDLEEALARAPMSQRPALRKAMRSLRQQLEGAALPDVPVDAWIANDGTLKKLSYEMTLDGLRDAPGPISIAATITVTDVGADFEIAVPPADQVTDVSDLAGLWADLGTGPATRS